MGQEIWNVTPSQPTSPAVIAEQQLKKFEFFLKLTTFLTYYAALVTKFAKQTYYGSTHTNNAVYSPLAIVDEFISAYKAGHHGKKMNAEVAAALEDIGEPANINVIFQFIQQVLGGKYDAWMIKIRSIFSLENFSNLKEYETDREAQQIIKKLQLNFENIHNPYQALQAMKGIKVPGDFMPNKWLKLQCVCQVIGKLPSKTVMPPHKKKAISNVMFGSLLQNQTPSKKGLLAASRVKKYSDKGGDLSEVQKRDAYLLLLAELRGEAVVGLKVPAELQLAVKAIVALLQGKDPFNPPLLDTLPKKFDALYCQQLTKDLLQELVVLEKTNALDKPPVLNNMKNPGELIFKLKAMQAELAKKPDNNEAKLPLADLQGKVLEELMGLMNAKPFSNSVRLQSKAEIKADQSNGGNQFGAVGRCFANIKGIFFGDDSYTKVSNADNYSSNTHNNG